MSNGKKIGIFKEYSEDAASVELKGCNIKTLEDTLKKAKVDLDVWDVEKYTQVYYNILNNNPKLNIHSV